MQDQLRPVSPLVCGLFLCLCWWLLFPPLGLISAKKSLALNGYSLVDCCPVVLKETSTRRLLARTITCRLFSICCLSAGAKSGSCDISSFIWSTVSWFPLPKDRVSRWSSGTPCPTKKVLVRSTRRAVSALLYSSEPRGSA